MQRQILNSLTRFCAAQQHAFDGRAWLGGNAIDARVISLAAKYLSMTSWYGHEEDLENIAGELNSRVAACEAFNREVEDLRFDLAYLSAAIRCEVARQRTARTRGKASLPAPGEE